MAGPKARLFACERIGGGRVTFLQSTARTAPDLDNRIAIA
jgi:hypothetical protein